MNECGHSFVVFFLFFFFCTPAALSTLFEAQILVAPLSHLLVFSFAAAEFEIFAFRLSLVIVLASFIRT